MPGKFDRCVRKVKRRSKAVNPYAVCTSSLSRNPRVTREKRAARDLWREFREEEPRGSRAIKIQWPKALMVMGRARLIAYDTTHGGKFVPYEHEFAPGSGPLLCAGKQPGQLFLIGTGFKVDAHGIVDIDAQGRRKKYKPRLKVVRRGR